MSQSTLSVTKSVLTSAPDSDVRVLATLYNKLAHIVAALMPGCLTSDPASKKGTSAQTAWRTEAFTFLFRGKSVSAAAQEKALTATTHDTAASKEAWYVLSLQSDGTTFTITKGADQTIGTKVLPIIPDNEVAVSWLQIITGSGGIFDASSDDLEVGGNITTINFYDADHLTLLGDGSSVEVTV